MIPLDAGVLTVCVFIMVLLAQLKNEYANCFTMSERQDFDAAFFRIPGMDYSAYARLSSQRVTG
jgi:hypothetical protein